METKNLIEKKDKLWYRKPRWSDRAKKDDWLPPSLKHKLDTRNKIFMLKTRDKIVKTILNKYTDIPNILHEKEGSGTTKELVVDEIVVMGVRETIKTIFCKIGEIDSQKGKITTKDYQEVLKALLW